MSSLLCIKMACVICKSYNINVLKKLPLTTNTQLLIFNSDCIVKMNEYWNGSTNDHFLLLICWSFTLIYFLNFKNFIFRHDSFLCKFNCMWVLYFFLSFNINILKWLITHHNSFVNFWQFALWIFYIAKFFILFFLYCHE